MKGCGSLSILVAFVTALAQPTLKIYVEAPDVPAAIQVLKSKCPVCSVVIKKDTADFVMILGADKFAVFENAQGQLLKDGSAGTTEDAVVACLDAIRAHAESRPAAQQNVTSGAKALIHVYRYKQFVGAAVEPSIYCNEVQVARMDNGRYFTMELDPGKYVLRSE